MSNIHVMEVFLVGNSMDLSPIAPVVRVLKEGESGNECKRRFFPKRHLWEVARETNIFRYEQCCRCREKRLVQIRVGHEPRAIGWETVETVERFEEPFV